jgi:predicted site-specific integrase-resolvase
MSEVIHDPKPVVILDQKAAAERLNVSVRTLERWRLSNDGPSYVKYTDTIRGAVRYRESDLEAWIASRVRASTSEAASSSPPQHRPLLEARAEAREAASQVTLEELGR